MQMLSKSLVDIFPFIYSRSEFRDQKNRKILLSQLKKLSQTAHELPEAGGKVFLGAEPLVRDARTSITLGFEKAYVLYSKKEYAPAQKAAQDTVLQCFACHTANQVGPRFSTTNSEVMNIATPFAQGKVFVYGALRQFSAALEFIEKQPPSMEYLKLHLVLSLRALQDFERADRYLEKASLVLGKKNKGDTELLGQWRKDIAAWKSATESSPQKVESVANGSAFVSDLRESLALHSRVRDSNLTAQARRESGGEEWARPSVALERLLLPRGLQ